MTEHSITKRCSVCGRFRSYDPEDEYCIVCGNHALEVECTCGRAFDYALRESGPIHCPHCGRSFHGKSPEFDA